MDNAMTICPICQKRFLPLQEKWVQMSPDVLRIIHERKVEVQEKKCPPCARAYDQILRTEERKHVFSLWATKP